jgi:hypothetical protein
MTKLDLQVQALKGKLLLDDSQVEAIAEAMRSHTADALNISQFLLAKNADPDTIRIFIEDYGITFDGKSKKFK